MERASTAIYANNYGEAGAINRYGPAYGLPTAISGINSYWARGYGDVPPTTVIVLGDAAEGVADTPATSPLAARARIPHGDAKAHTGHHDILIWLYLTFQWPQERPLMRSYSWRPPG